MENELYHHGVKGQKWGVRRYQNPDGSLTPAGKKRALKVQNQYTELSKNKKYHDKDGNLTYEGRKKALKMKEQYSDITGKSLRPFKTNNVQSPNNSNNIQKTNTKSISEMSNKEIQDRIDRIILERRLSDLTPQEVSTGRKLVDGMKGAAISIAKDKGTKIVGDLIDKKLRDKLGLSNKDAKTASQILQEEAQKYENRQKIDKGQRYFKEGKYAEKNEESKTETYTGTVEREGSNRRKTDKNESSTNKKRYDEPIDAEWREVNDDDINIGRSYVSQLLLEDKKRK